MIFNKKYKLILSSIALFFIINVGHAQSKHSDIVKNKKGSITHVADSLGNQIPDFSYAGYMASEKAIPQVEARIFVPHQTDDATQKIQAAINYVGSLKPNASGFRGAVLLDKGTFKISGSLYINKSGVILRGSGNADNETLLLGTGIDREALIRVLGVDDRKYADTLGFSTTYTPLGTRKIQLKNTSKLKVSDEIIIVKPLTDNWIKELEMEEFGGETGWIGWKTRDWDITWNRIVTNSNGSEVTLNAPLTMALEDVYGKAEVIKYTWEGRIENVGVENLTMKSTYNASNLKDEQHRWFGITMENVKNAWVRQVHFRHFAGGAVSLLKSSQQITVEDCISTEPISEIASFRRHTFYTEGQQTLFQRCYSEYGYHDFAVGGYGTTGPNAFVQCESFMPYSNSGAIGSWATGVLFDIAYIDGDALSYNNREQNGRGAGWTAANSVIWESSASKIECYNPPTAQNWAFGVWGQFAGNGHWKDVNNHISPRSLFYAQLENRLEQLPVNPYVFDLGTEPSTSPTLEQAAELTTEALNPMKGLTEWIQEVSKLNKITINTSNIKSIDDLKLKSLHESENSKIAKVKIENGRLTLKGQVITGEQRNVMWWRGSLKDHDVKNASDHITRFAPGRTGKGFTDNLKDVVESFKKENVIALDHNYGLWYDRRMDDHERIRRIDADVWPPFYEQPFARTGKGLAWDHLSKYDLTKYNDWYWYRLGHFADLAEPNGQLLINQQYFQHNIIEAGAHWSSSPWRAANNINKTEFPEPVPYAGDKRIFMAEQFYDISNESRRKLHQGFIRKSLDNFQENSNVIQLTSAEYTGPLHFMEFWLDEAQKWKKETGKTGIIGLSATKDVQDAILKDAKRNQTVDLIDIRYWHYREDGSVYAPEGGKNLAPRQHARKMSVGKETEEQVYRAVSEYREKYPNKVVLYSTNGSSKFGWPVLMAGGSLANIPNINISGFYESLSKMKINSNTNFNSKSWTLQNEGESYLLYLKDIKTVEVDLSSFKGNYEVFWIDPSNGQVVSKKIIQGKTKQTLIAPSEHIKVVYIKKK
ncbi:DUF6298 domain-containing protein [Mariniflexile litorale]|uniref:DUF6298 domain-containing protein n=1 Tax=Mariniflexile litorale TaxID=3045158 RepID=A0AAU7ECF1_9FLAO|nr:DUF6298 domain-containing protein [Mariniflexile sp. KMM 9835]MDQ8210548.1 DUF6298 domain-containing protein [Mariniflexile sp. KMM 9835]